MQHSGLGQYYLNVDETCFIGNANNCDTPYYSATTMGNIDNDSDHDGSNSQPTNRTARAYGHQTNMNREQLGASVECQTRFLSSSTIVSVRSEDHHIRADRVAKNDMMYAQRIQQMTMFHKHTGTRNMLFVETNEHVDERADTCKTHGGSLLCVVDNSVSIDGRVNDLHTDAHGDYTEPSSTVEKVRADDTYPRSERCVIRSKTRPKAASAPIIAEHENIAALSSIVEWKLRGLQTCVKYLRRNQMFHARSMLLHIARDRRNNDGSEECIPHMTAYEVNGDDALQELGDLQKETITSSWKRARETITSVRHFVEHDYLSTNDSLIAECTPCDQMQFDGQEKTTQEQATATPTNRMVKLAKSQTLIVRNTEMQRQIGETYSRRSSSGDVTTQIPYHSCNVQTFQMACTRTTDAVDSPNISQNANDNSGNERASVFRSTWTPAIGKNQPMKQNYIPQGAAKVSPMSPDAARENIRISDDEFGRVSGNDVGMPTGGLTHNERSQFIQQLEQMSNQLFQNSPAMKQQAQRKYIQSPPAPTQTRVGYIQPQQLTTPTDVGYTRPIPRLSQAYAPPIYAPNSQPPRLSTVPSTGYIQPPPRLSQAYVVPQIIESTRRPTESFGAWSSLGPTYQLTSESPSPLYSHGMSSPSPLESRGRSSPYPLYYQGRYSPSPQYYQGSSSSSSSSSESVTAERRRSSTAQIVSDTLKGAEYNVMYMCDPKNPDIIQKLAIIPSHCLHDHDVCVRRIKQAERPTKRGMSSSDDAADTRRNPSPKRFTRRESEKRRKRILPKTITLTDRFGIERRLRLKRRRHGPSFRISRTRRNIERPRQSDYTRRVHINYYTHQREDDPWRYIHPSRVHSDEQVRSRRVLSDESLRAHSAPYDDDIRQRQVTEDSRRRHQVRTGTKDRTRRGPYNRHGYPQKVLSDENGIPGRSSAESDSSDESDDSSSDERDARKKEKKADREKKAKKAAKKEKRKKGWKKKKTFLSRMLFGAHGKADQAGYDSGQSDEDWSDDSQGAATSTLGTRPDGGNIKLGTTGKAGKSQPRGIKIRSGRVKDKTEDRRQTEANIHIRRTSQYLQDVSKKRKPGKQHHQDKQSKKETEKQARFDQLDTRNLVPLPYPAVPTMNLHRPSDASFGGNSDSDVSLNENTDARKKKSKKKAKKHFREVVGRKSGRRKSKLPAKDGDDEDSEFEANELQFWGARVARKTLEQDMRKRKVNIGQGRSAQMGFQVPTTDTKRHSVMEDRRQIGFQMPNIGTKRQTEKAGTQPHTGGTAVRRGNNAYDAQTTIRPSVSPQLRSEANRRRTSQYVQDVSQISEPIIVRQTEPVTYAVRGKQHNKDKQSNTDTEEHARFDQLDTINLVPLTHSDVPTMNVQNRSTQQRSNNNVGNSYPSFTVPDDTLVTRHDEQSRQLWSDQDEAAIDDVRTMGQERFRMIRDAFETGYFVSVICD